MSRIHEALKKAEQEKSSQLPSSSVAPVITSETIEVQVPQVTPAAQAPPTIPAVKGFIKNNTESQWVSKSTSSTEHSGGKKPTAPLRWPASTGARIQLEANFPLALDHNHVVAAEAFSILRSRLLSVHNRLGIRSVIITSAEAEDGKTLIATNMALSLGQLGSKRVLLVDGDLRVATATRILKLKNLPGLGEFLQDQEPFEAIVHATGFPALSVVPAGLVPDKAMPEVLQGPRWAEFLEQAKQMFDLIVIDSLPVSAPVVDLELSTAACDAFLCVVRIRQTRRQSLNRVKSRLDPKKFLGVILNNADELYDYDYEYYSRSPEAQ